MGTVRIATTCSAEEERDSVIVKEHTMEELLLAVAKGLVEDKDAVTVTVDEANEDGIIVYHLTVAEDDMGRVIGKQGRIAKAIRVVMRAAAVREGTKVMVEIG